MHFHGIIPLRIEILQNSASTQPCVCRLTLSLRGPLRYRPDSGRCRNGGLWLIYATCSKAKGEGQSHKPPIRVANPNAFKIQGEGFMPSLSTRFERNSVLVITTCLSQKS